MLGIAPKAGHQSLGPGFASQTEYKSETEDYESGFTHMILSLRFRRLHELIVLGVQHDREPRHMAKSGRPLCHFEPTM